MKNKAIVRWIGFAAGVMILLLAAWMMRGDGQDGNRGTDRTDGTDGGTTAVAVERDAAAVQADGPPREAGEIVRIADGESKEVVLRLTPRTRVIGRALEEGTKKPIPGIRFSTEPYFEQGQLREVAHRQEVVSDRDGRFELDAYPESGGSGKIFFLAPDGYLPITDASSMDQISYLAPANQASTMMEASFRRGYTLHGRVLKSDGISPAIGALVRLRSTLGWSADDWTTDEAGLFKAIVLPGMSYMATAKSPDGHGMVEFATPIDHDPSPLLITLQALAAIDGHVVDPQGDPVSGVTIGIQQHVDTIGQTLIISSPANPRVRTDEKGQFYAGELPAGGYTLSAMPGSSSPHGPSESREITLQPGEYRRGEEFVLTRFATLEGVVVDEEEHPIAGARIAIHSEDLALIGRSDPAVTDEEGRFRIEGLSPEIVFDWMNVNHPEYEPYFKQTITTDDSPMRITLLKKGDLVIEAVEAGTDLPVQHFFYRLTNAHRVDDPSLERHSSVEVRDPNGRIAITGLNQAGLRIDVVELDDNGSPTGRKGTARSSSNATPVRVMITGGATIRGQLKSDGSGKPLGGITVTLQGVGLSAWNNPSQHAAFSPPSDVSDADGQFELSGMAPGLYSPILAGTDLVLKEEVIVTVAGGIEPDPVTLLVTEKSVLYGRALDREGNPIVGARINHHMLEGMKPNSIPVSIPTDENGEYRLEDILPGVHSLDFTTPDGPYNSRVKLSVSGGEEKRVDFDFTARIEVFGRILVNGQPPDKMGDIHFTNTLVGEASSNPIIETDGSYRTYLSPGSYQVLHARSGNAFLARVTFQVMPTPARQQQDLSVNYCDVDVVVVFPDDDAAVDGFVLLQRTDGPGQPFSRHLTSTSPGARFEGVNEGVYQAVFRSQDKSIQVSSSETRFGPGLENVIVIEVSQQKVE